MKRLARHRQPAQAFAWTGVLLLLVLLPMMGLAIDTGVLFNAQRRLQMSADGAARVGAMQVDEAVARSSSRVALDPGRARDAAEEYLADTPGVEGSAQADTDHVEVLARRQVRLAFQQLLKMPPTVIQARAQAVPCSGITGADGQC